MKPEDQHSLQLSPILSLSSTVPSHPDNFTVDYYDVEKMELGPNVWFKTTKRQADEPN